MSEVRDALQCAGNVLALLSDEVKALGLRAQNVPEKVADALERLQSSGALREVVQMVVDTATDSTPPELLRAAENALQGAANADAQEVASLREALRQIAYECEIWPDVIGIARAALRRAAND